MWYSNILYLDNMIFNNYVRVLPMRSRDFSSVSDSSKRKLVIQVVDNGVGIAPENQHKMFQQFTQFDANNLQGLSISLLVSLSDRLFAYLFA